MSKSPTTILDTIGNTPLLALRLAERLGPQATVVTILCDTGMKYLKAFSQDLKL